MPTDFDKAFTEAAGQREAEARSKVLKEQEAEHQQHLARSIAEPYLRALGSEVRERLLELRIPPLHCRQRVTLSIPSVLQDDRSGQQISFCPELPPVAGRKHFSFTGRTVPLDHLCHTATGFQEDRRV